MEHQHTNPLSHDTHGHDVMDMMRASGKLYTRQSLLADILQTFGKHATFCTCAAKGLNAEQLIDFLDSRGKFKLMDGGFRLASGSQCDHD